MKRGLIYWGALLTVGTALAAAPQDATDRFYEVIRNNDLNALRALVKTSDVNSKDKRGTTPLMYSAAVGSTDAMRLLIETHADVNAKNAFDATPLMWCATNLDKVRLLVEHGANVNAQSKPGRTPLLIAAASDGSYAVVKYLLEKGANPTVKDSMQQTALLAAITGNDTATIQLLVSKNVDVNAKDAGGQTALMGAAANGNLEIIRLLLAKGADVNATSAAEIGPGVKNGPIALGSLTPLLLAAAYGGPETVKVLLDAGAKVNAQDVRGMTPLMLAVATDHPNPATVKLLLAKGADAALKSKNGESVIDWAKKYQCPPVLAALGVEQARNASPVKMVPVADEKTVSPAVAVQKSLGALQGTSASFFNAGGCFACHAQNMTGMAIAVARERGFKVDDKTATELARGVRIGWSSFEQPLLQRMDPPGGADMLDYALLEMAAGSNEADRTTDALVHNLAAQQLSSGNWHLGGIARPPMEDGDFARTALAIRALQLFGPEGRRSELSDRVGRASGWLMRAEPRTTEDRDMQLMGLKWANAEPALIERLTKQLMSQQRSDGGWAQTPELESDAYATGQALYALHESGVSSANPVYRRGVAYLVKSQLENGSWHVASRSVKFQPYFQSGFPHDHDQWISAAGTAWATIALAYAEPEKAAVAQR